MISPIDAYLIMGSGMAILAVLFCVFIAFVDHMDAHEKRVHQQSQKTR